MGRESEPGWRLLKLPNGDMIRQRDLLLIDFERLEIGGQEDYAALLRELDPQAPESEEQR